MIDSVIAGTGDSRYLRTSLAADTTWEDALTMLRAGTFPIDLAGINAAGFTTVGTALTSATLLKAAVCIALGLDANATPSDAWEAVIALIEGKADADAVITAIGYDSSTKTLTATINGVVTDVTTFDFVNAAEAAEAAPVQPEDLYKAFPTDAVSGPFASFPDGADSIPVKDLSVAITPSQSGSGDPSPSNVRPISGWTEMSIRKMGKNIASPDMTDGTTAGVAYTLNPDGSVTGQGTCTSSSSVKSYTSKFYLPVGVSFIVTGTGSQIRVRVNTQDASGTVQRRIFDDGNGVEFALREGEVSISVGLSCTVNDVVDETIYPMVRSASIESAEWSPYSGSVIAVTFPSEAGTVYGGTLDLTTGQLVVTHGNIAAYNGESLPGKWISDRDVYAPGTTPSTGAQVVYELSAPVTYQLTPQEVRTILGSNNIWADTGDTAVVYRADPTLYIQKLTGSTEEDMIANESIASGKYFMVGNRLFYSTAAIAAGAMLTVGTNCVETNLAAALNALNS